MLHPEVLGGVAALVVALLCLARELQRKPIMARKAKHIWSESVEGIAAYKVARAKAQAAADDDGFDRGIEANNVFKEWTIRVLPAKKYRFGFEARIECVMCSDVSKCQPGHGPMARGS